MMENPLPVMQVYDQTKFIEKQDNKIKKIKNEAKALNNIAQDMNDQIYRQDDKLSDLTKELANDLDQIKGANDELEEARERSSGTNSTLICWVLIVFILLAIFGVSMWLLTRTPASKPDGGGSSSESPSSGNFTGFGENRMFEKRAFEMDRGLWGSGF